MPGFDDLMSTVQAAPAPQQPAASGGFDALMQSLEPSAEEYAQRSQAAGVSVGRTPEEHAKILRQKGYSPEAIKELGKSYKGALAERQVQGETPAFSEAPLGAMKAALRDTSMPFFSLFKNPEKQQQDAETRIADGTAKDSDYLTVARARQKATDENQIRKDYGVAGDVLLGLRAAPAIVGEFMAGGALAKGLGVGQVARTTLGGQLGSHAARMALVTPAVPSMWLESMRQKNVENGRPADSWEGMPSAMLHTYANLLVLGSVFRGAPLGSGVAAGVKEAVKKGVTGAVEQGIADSATNFADNFIPKAYKISTGYGTFEHLMNGDVDAATRKMGVDALTFSAFAGMHRLAEGGTHAESVAAAERAAEVAAESMGTIKKWRLSSEESSSRFAMTLGDLGRKVVAGEPLRAEPTNPLAGFTIKLSQQGDGHILNVRDPSNGNRQVGLFGFKDAEVGGNKYLSAEMVNVRPEHEGKGIGTEMYKHVLDNLPEGYDGIFSPDSSRVNKEQVPRIHQKLTDAGYTVRRVKGGVVIEPPKSSRAAKGGAESAPTADAFPHVPDADLIDIAKLSGVAVPRGKKLTRLGAIEGLKGKGINLDVLFGKAPTVAPAEPPAPPTETPAGPEIVPPERSGASEKPTRDALAAEQGVNHAFAHEPGEDNYYHTASYSATGKSIQHAIDVFLKVRVLKPIDVWNNNNKADENAGKNSVTFAFDKSMHAAGGGKVIPEQRAADITKVGFANPLSMDPALKKVIYRGSEKDADFAKLKEAVDHANDLRGDVKAPPIELVATERTMPAAESRTAPPEGEFGKPLTAEEKATGVSRGGSPLPGEGAPGEVTYRPTEEPGAPKAFGGPPRQGKETALANAMTDQERVANRLPPLMSEARQANEAIWDAAMNRVDAEPGVEVRLVDELSAKPRATTIEENALLLHRRIALSNEYQRAMNAANSAFMRKLPQGEIDAAFARADSLLAEIDRTDQVIRKTGSEWGKAGQFRRQLAREDYSLGTMMGRAQQAKGEVPLTQEEKVEIAAAHDAITKADEKLAELEAVRDERAATIAGEPTARDRAETAAAQEKIDAAATRIAEIAVESRGLEESEVPAETQAELEALREDIRRANARVSELEADRAARAEAAKAAEPKSGSEAAKKEETALADARIAARKTRAAFAEKIDGIRVENLPTHKRIFHAIGETFNASRSIITAFDLSAVFRQGGFFALSHPIQAAKAIPDMLRAFGSEQAYQRQMDAIQQRPKALRYEKSGLELTDDTGPLRRQEESFMGKWVGKIPGVKAAARAYNGYLNRVRADLFDGMTDTMERSGKGTDAEDKAIANFINVQTGRGPLGATLERAAVPLATLFFSPRFVVSRFQLMAGQPMYGGTSRTRGLVAKEYARALAGLGLLYTLASMDDDAKITFDPRSSDFGKIRFGNSRVDPLAGLAQVAVFVSRLTSGETVTARGKVEPLRDSLRYSAKGKVPFGGSTVTDVVDRFVRSKLAPVPGAVADALAGKNVVGEPTTTASTVGHLTIPMSVKDVYKALEDQGMPRGAAIGLLAILGMGAQTYESKKPGVKPKVESIGEQLLR